MYKVLIVDDESMITMGMQALLNWEDYGFEIVATAESGEQALDFLMDNTIDLLITDILMDEMTGLELIKEAAKVQPHIKSIVLTGYQEFKYIKQSLLLGVENYLVKPVDENELVTTIQNIGQKMNAINSKNQSEQSFTLKDNTLWQFLNGEIDKHDCLERLSLYNVQFEYPFFNVSILSFENYHHTQTTKDIRNYIESNYTAACLYSPNQELLIIFEGSSEEQLFYYNQALVDYLKTEQNNTGFFYLSMGKSVNTMEGIEDSFTNAIECSLLELYSHPNVLISERFVVDKQDELKKQQAFKDDIVKQLLQPDGDSIKVIDDFFQDLIKHSKYISPQVARRYTFDFISCIHYSLKTDDLSYYTASVEKIAYSQDVGQLKEILKEYCHELMLSIHQQTSERSPIVQNVLDYIHTHYNKGISLKTLGQQFHVNAIYLGQLFQKELGVVFSEYLNRYRLEKAKELLKTTHYRAGEIGIIVGYSDTTYFYKQFKKNVGATPSKWRKI
ncbi:putative response regulatory protein [Paraliobacillus sp. PM-2]|uniref:response regulator transcription factor n=1 Tax=Paraliobacillus sp. PM-2 TaxID=1462524 RepID=UPI00061CC262|nr:response regulator transcription factor [Paraliobacillus sp. PM-2]CQR45853.1 putative response regulatory protein [Paraliobacillus sp. PM-2]